MNTFSKKSLCAAIAGIGALGAAGTSQAVFVNPDGLGQVLIYPYYTVRVAQGGAYTSLLSVVNSTASAKAVKVRFIEGRNSAEVLDFNLFLSAKDVWTAAIVNQVNGAAVFSPDRSCTVPTLPSTAATAQPFVNFAYVGDGGGDTLDRTREGYVEIIEMGAIRAGSTTETGVTHVSGVPTCKNTDDASGIANTVNPTGGLFGGMTLINVLSGTDFGVDAVALDAFRTTGRYDLPGTTLPDLSNAFPFTATVFSGGVAITESFGSGIDAVSAVLMHDHVYNEFVLDSLTRSGTDWVITMPTKKYYYNADGSVNNLFQRNFEEDIGACDDVSLQLYDREEFRTAPGFSPPPRVGVNAMCWEANVITFNNSNVFGSNNVLNIPTTFQNGWADIGFPIPTSSDGFDPHQLFGTSRVFFGLPTVGFAAVTFNNGTLSTAAGLNVQSQYGSNFNHKGTRSFSFFLP